LINPKYILISFFLFIPTKIIFPCYDTIFYGSTYDDITVLEKEKNIKVNKDLLTYRLNQKLFADNISEGKSVYQYFENMFSKYYKNDVDKYPDIKRRVNNFLVWVSVNARLHDDFMKAFDNNLIILKSNNSRTIIDTNIFPMFACWLGIKYSQDKCAEYLGFNKQREIELSEYSGVNYGQMTYPDKMQYGYNTDIQNETEEFIAAFCTGIHEMAHLIGKDTSLSEYITCLITDSLALPINIYNSKDYQKTFSYNLSTNGRRNFYDIFVKSQTEKSESRKEVYRNKFYYEYCEYVFYPWIKVTVNKDNYSAFRYKNNPPDFRTFGEVFDKLKSSYSDIYIITESICQRIYTSDSLVKRKLNIVFSKLNNKFGNKKNEGDIIEFTSLFAELMNEEFGKPDIELWKEYL
jgi:hypothetical protein